MAKPGLTLGRSPRAAGARRPARARGIDRVVHILDHLYRRGEPVRANDLAAEIGAPKSSVYEIVNRLSEARILEPMGEGRRVFLGRRLYYYGNAYLRRFDIAREAEGLLAALAGETGETSQLCMVEGGKYVVALMKEGARHFRISSDVGRPIPLPWTASGRVLVGSMSDGDVLRFIPRQDFALPNGARLSPELFLRQVRQARAQGLYSCDSVLDSFTHCIAAPVLDDGGRCLATMCLVVPREDAQKHRGALVQALRRHARLLSRRLGARRTGEGESALPATPRRAAQP
ncbi:MAG: IclR family transcriptional regulator [Rhodospirillales bacterium]